MFCKLFETNTKDNRFKTCASCDERDTSTTAHDTNNKHFETIAEGACKGLGKRKSNFLFAFRSFIRNSGCAEITSTRK